METTSNDLIKLSNVVKNDVFKKTEYDELVKKLIRLIVLILVKFNKLTADNFTVRLAQAYVASKNDIANFAKKTYFDDKLKNLNKKITSNNTKNGLVENLKMN